jgi:hypothetical protein
LNIESSILCEQWTTLDHLDTFLRSVVPCPKSIIGPRSRNPRIRKLGPEYPHISFTSATTATSTHVAFDICLLSSCLILCTCQLLLRGISNEKQHAIPPASQSGSHAHTIESIRISQGISYCDKGERGVTIEGDQSVGYDQSACWCESFLF